MANPIDRELFDRLRAGGLRKSVARVISEATATGKGASGRAETAARDAIKELRSLADELEDRLRGGPAKQRSAAAQKAANTRKRQAAARSAAAKKAAATRAKRVVGHDRRARPPRRTTLALRRRSAPRRRAPRRPAPRAGARRRRRSPPSARSLTTGRLSPAASRGPARWRA